MHNITRPNINKSTGVHTLKSATIKGYEYTKSYYKIENGVPVRCEKGDDSCLTIVHIRKIGADPSKKRSAFILSEGYVGAEKAYNEDGTKKKSLARKDAFGIAYLIKYIEEQREKETSEEIDDFHVMFLSNEETSEDQALLYAEALKDIVTDDVETAYIWNHSKSGLLALRAFEKMKESGDEQSQKVLGKVKAVLTSLSTKGINSVDREAVVNKINKNIMLNILPFSGFIKNAILSFYDKNLYRPTPAQVDLKKTSTELELQPIEHASAFRRFFDIAWGNTTFRNRVFNFPKVQYDAGYLDRTVGEESLKTIEDVDYRIIPVNIEIEDAFKALVKHGQLMPLVLYAKKALSKEKGDGIVTYSEQGIEDIKAKYDTSIEIRAGHDMPTTPEALETVGEALLKDRKSLREIKQAVDSSKDKDI